MSIQLKNDITGDSGKAKEVVFSLHLPMHIKHSNHLTRGESDRFEWGSGGKCDDDRHKVSCKVNIPHETDEHPEIEAQSGDTITVKFSDGNYKLTK